MDMQDTRATVRVGENVKAAPLGEEPAQAD